MACRGNKAVGKVAFWGLFACLNAFKKSQNEHF